LALDRDGWAAEIQAAIRVRLGIRVNLGTIK
jgi:hypothetical protein